MNIVNLHIGKLNLYYVAYLYDGRERKRERERESTLQDHVRYNYIRRIAFSDRCRKTIL